MNLFDVSKDVFASLIDDIRVKAIENEEYNDTCPDNILNILPTEILEYIFTFLPQTDLYSLRRVCKKFKKAASVPQVLRLHPSSSFEANNLLDQEMLGTFLRNLITLRVSLGNQQTENGEFDGTVAVKLFNELQKKCSSLQNLYINWGTIPSAVSLGPLSERLSHLSIDSIVFKNASHFFADGAQLYKNLNEFELRACSGFKEILPFDNIPENAMCNLRVLRLAYMDEFSNRALKSMKKILYNVKELYLTHIPIDNEAFIEHTFKNLTTLHVEKCQVKGNWLSYLKHMPTLEELHLMELALSDTCSREAFMNLTKVQRLEIQLCPIGDHTMNAMGEYLPSLVKWVIIPEDNSVTDGGLVFLKEHKSLEHISLDRMRITDVGLSKIVTRSPALKRLEVNTCNCGDEAMPLLAANLTHLTLLALQGTRMTDIGLLALEARLGTLEELRLESRFITVAGIMHVLPLLSSAKIVNVTFGDPPCEIQYNGMDDNYSTLDVNGNELTGDIVIMLTRRFSGVKSLTLVNLTLGPAQLEVIIETQSTMTSIMISQCIINVDTLLMLFSSSNCVQDLDLSQCNLTDEAMQKIMQKIQKPLERMTIHNETFPSEETFQALVPLMASLSYIQMSTVEFEVHFLICNNEYEKCFNCSGNSGQRFNDNSIVAMANNFKQTNAIMLEKTTVTDNGISLIAQILTHLTSVHITSNLIGDEAMKIIGEQFASLTSLTTECERITDEGLNSLGKQLQSLESLTVVKCGITDEGVKRVAPFLGSVRYLDLYHNPKVTQEVITYMTETYPEISHNTAADPTDADQEWAIDLPINENLAEDGIENPEQAIAQPAEEQQQQVAALVDIGGLADEEQIQIIRDRVHEELAEIAEEDQVHKGLVETAESQESR